jgi:TonB family protein
MNAAAAQERWQGQIIDHKVPLLDWLGGSPNTAVYRTELSGSAQPAAAIKLVRAESVNASKQLARWKESESISHSNLLRIFESGYCQITGAHWLYIVTEFAEENLDQILPVRPLTANEVADLLPPMLEALAFLHAKRLVHGRIRPSNIFAVKNQLKISIDSVRLASEPARPHQISAFDAPEIVSGAASGATDIWSLGMTIVTAFNQRPLSWSRTSQSDPVVPKEVPAPYNLMACECLRINPAERCSLQRIKELSRQAVSLTAPAETASPKRNFIAPGIALVVAAAVALGLMIAHSSYRAPANPAPQASAGNGSSVSHSESASSQTAKGAEAQAEAGQVPTGASQVSGAEHIVQRVLPQVPQSALNTIHGRVKVKVRVAVAPSGEVSAASLALPGPSRYFARVALEAARKWKFEPQPTTSTPAEWLIQFKFGRSSIEDTAERLR